jgi:hypothetical protein
MMEEVEQSSLAQDRGKWSALVNTVMNLQVHKRSGKLSGGCTTAGLYSNAQVYSYYIDAYFRFCAAIPYSFEISAILIEQICEI